MNIQVTFRHMDSSTRLRERIVEKLEHLDHYFDQVQDVHVVLSQVKLDNIAEVTVHSPGEVFKATAKKDDMNATIDAIAEKLERHLVRRKERVKLEPHKAVPLGSIE